MNEKKLFDNLCFLFNRTKSFPSSVPSHMMAPLLPSNCAVILVTPAQTTEHIQSRFTTEAKFFLPKIKTKISK